MTLLSRKADYAMLIVSYLHARPEGGNARAIAERFGLSRPFVANILKELCHRGYVVGGISPLGQRRTLPTVVDRCRRVSGAEACGFPQQGRTSQRPRGRETRFPGKAVSARPAPLGPVIDGGRDQ